VELNDLLIEKFSGVGKIYLLGKLGALSKFV
jgi:hypothetical protein